MTIVYTPKDAILDSVAVVLILMPEPASTAVGIAMLCRPRGKGGTEAHQPTHPITHAPEYVYRVDNIRGRDISWQARTILPGQLPMRAPNKPEIKIKERQQYIMSRTQAEKSTSDRIRESLPPGVKVHHEIYRTSKYPASNQQPFIPGETIHHTLKSHPQDPPAVNRGQQTYIHHTIENSPGYIKAQAGGQGPAGGNGLQHHTIRFKPGVQNGNPANIVKPVHIVEHHTLNPNPEIRTNGRVINQPLIPPAGKNNTPVKRPYPKFDTGR